VKKAWRFSSWRRYSDHQRQHRSSAGLHGRCPRTVAQRHRFLPGIASIARGHRGWETLIREPCSSVRYARSDWPTNKVFTRRAFENGWQRPRDYFEGAAQLRGGGMSRSSSSSGCAGCTNLELMSICNSRLVRPSATSPWP